MIKALYKNKSGFTLVEMLVAIFVFSLLSLAVAGIYVAFNNTQIRTSAEQQLLNDTQYAIELMVREIRNNKVLNNTRDLLTYPEEANGKENAWCNDVITYTTDVFNDCIVLEKENGQVFAFATIDQGGSNKELWHIILDNCGDDYLSCDSWKNDYSKSTKILAANINDINVASLDFDITPIDDPYVYGGSNEQTKVTIKMTTSFDSTLALKQVSHTFQTTVSSRIYQR